jgi:hypothetical protein
VTTEFPTDLASAHLVITRNLAIINELTHKNQNLIEDNRRLIDKSQELQQQLDWFYRQLFGEKSEKVIRELPGSKQLWLGGEPPPEAQAAATVTVKEHARIRRGMSLKTTVGNPGFGLIAQCRLKRFPVRRLRLRGFRPRTTI